MSHSQAFASRVLYLPPQLHGLAALSALLERMERNTGYVDPEQYRLLVQRIGEQLDRHSMDPALGALLDAFTATAEIYENRRYDWAGLCRAPLERSVDSERQAREWLRRAARDT